MNVKYFLLGKAKHKIRSIALKHYLNNKNPEKAIELATNEIRTSSIIATILIGIAIKLATELIWYWIKNSLSHPSLFYSEKEPGY